MNLLISKDGDGAEFNEVLGFVDSDIKVSQMLPYLTAASRKLEENIGMVNYQLLYADSQIVEPKEETKLAKYAVCLEAFRQMAPLLDVSYTPNGRVFRSNENEKPLFEWMADRSDDAMERSYYATLNQLFKTLLASPSYQPLPPMVRASENLVSSLDVFQKFTFIDDSYLLFFTLINSLRTAERRLVRSRLGSHMDDIYTEKFRDVLEVAQNLCVFAAMSDGLRRNSVQLFPRGVVQEVRTSRQRVPARTDIEHTAKYYDDEVSLLSAELEKLVLVATHTRVERSPFNFDASDGFVTL